MTPIWNKEILLEGGKWTSKLRWRQDHQQAVVGPSKSNFNNVTLPDEDEGLLILLLYSDRLRAAVNAPTKNELVAAE